MFLKSVISISPMQKISLQTFGCAANVAEGEMMQGILTKEGHEIVKNTENADVIVLNLCTVKGNNAALNTIKQTQQQFPNKKIIIAGCIPHDLVSQLHTIAPTASLLNTHNIHKITTAVEQPITFLERTNEHKISLPRIRKNPIIGILPISSGCDSACTFCSVKFIKGNHVSYLPEKIINEVETCVHDGCKEIWLTGQDTSCYGTDFGKNLPCLLTQLCNIPGDFKIRLGMANPKHIKNYVHELINIYHHEKMFQFLHIPVQSGNNEILTAMKRGYTIEDFKTIAAIFRKTFPHLTLSTDIICGFPGETEEQFSDTLNLLKEYQFDVVNISRFIPRQGTAAAKMNNQLSWKEKKLRTKKITQAFVWGAYERNKQWLNWQGPIIIDERGKHNTFIGRNYTYKPVVIKEPVDLGQTVHVRIIDTATHYLRGELV